PFAVAEIVYWQLGSLADRSLPYLWLVLPLMAISWALLLVSGPALDGLTLGEDTAKSLGFNLARLRLQLIAGAALAVGSAVVATGIAARFGKTSVLEVVDFAAGAGEMIRIIGPNGSGETTLLRIHANIRTHEDVSVHYDSRTATKIGRSVLARHIVYHAKGST